MPTVLNVVALSLVALPVLVAIYAYLVYPALLWVLARRADARASTGATHFPIVTIVVPVYNEEAQIRGAIESLLAQDYDATRRQMLIVSDASTDGTDAIVGGYSNQGVELLRMPARGGKTAAENTSLAHIRGEIVINCDASVRLHTSAVRTLVAAMADPGVGVASTMDVSVSSTGAGTSSAEAGYVGYEMRIRALETRTGGIVGASGSGYAIRASLHRHSIRFDLSRDFSAALTARRHGFRAVSVEDAICFVPRTSSLAHEYRRKVRTIRRGMGTLIFNRDLLDPLRHGAFAWKLASHKVLRWLVPLSTLPALVGLLILAPKHQWSRWLLVAALGILALAILGARWPAGRPVPRFLPAGILGALAANLAVLHAAWRVVRGHGDQVWEPTRRAHVANTG